MSFADFKLIGINRFPTSLYMWGDNTNGLLGDNRTPSYFSWSKISSGGLHTVAIRSDGTLFAWGRNTEFQLGDTTTVHRSSPVQIGTSSWNAVSAGTSHTVAIKGDSTLWIWGANRYGQLGLGDTANRSSPVQVGTSSWSVISAGGNHSLGIKIDNSVFAWGFNGSGQLGDTTIASRSSPVQVGTSALTDANAYSLLFNGTTQYISVASNAAFDFGTNNFTIECWFNTSTVTGTQVLIDRWNFGTTIFLLRISGSSLNGWIGTSGTSNIIGGTVQVNVWNHAAFVRNGSVITLYLNGVSVGTPINTALAVTTGTSVVAIGGHGSEGIFGYVSNARIVNGTAVYTTSFTPSTTPLTAITNTSLLTAQNTTIVDNSTNAFTITNNGSVSYSISTPFTSALPSGAFTASIVSAGDSSSMAIDTNQNLYLWGANPYGSGFNDVITRSRPTQIVGSDKFTNISGGASNSLALTSSNILYTWGYNNNGQLGINDTINRSSPVQITSLSLVNRNSPTQITSSSYSLVSAGFNTSYAVKSNNILTVWGLNSAGQLGLSDTINRSSPTQINTSIIQISAGGSHASAVDSTTLLEAWGQNTNGQLGISLTTGRSSPVQVSAITTITASSPTLVTSGSYDNYYQSSPVQIGSSSWSLISAGTNTSLGMLTNNTLFAWGQNNYGQLGTNDTINRSSPVQIASGSFTHINAGENFSSLRKNDYSIYLFGENDVGQIGDLT